MTTTAAILCNGIRARWTPRLNEVSSPAFSSVSQWLETGAFTWLPSAGTGAAKIDLTTCKSAYAEALASEISRFSCAAFESLLGAGPQQPSSRSLAWPMIRHYYASFYCAHSFLRIGGQSLTFLPGSVTSKLNTIAAQYLGTSPGLQAGLYSIKIDPVLSNVLTVDKIAGGGGSHEDLWKRYLDYVKDIENLVLASQGGMPIALDAVEKSIALRGRLCQAGQNNGAWLSAIRNSINYRHDYGIWYPYSLSVTASDSLARSMNRWVKNDSDCFLIEDTQGHLRELVDISNFLARLLLDALTDIADRSPDKRRCFLQKDAFQFLRQRRVRIN